VFILSVKSSNIYAGALLQSASMNVGRKLSTLYALHWAEKSPMDLITGKK